MKKYFAILKIELIKHFTYPARVFIYFILDIIAVAIFPFIWLAAYDAQNNLNGLSRADITTYYVAVVFVSLAITSHISRYTNRDIRNGNLSGHLVRPINYIGKQYMHDLAYGFTAGTIFALILIPAHFIYPQIIFLPANLPTGLWFLVFIFIARLISFSLQLIAGLLTFWLGDIEGVMQLRGVLEKIFGGGFAPLSLFPAVLQTLARYLPFPFLYFIPVQVYLGKITGGELLVNATKGILWSSFFLIVIIILWRRGLKRFDGAGL